MGTPFVAGGRTLAGTSTSARLESLGDSPDPKVFVAATRQRTAEPASADWSVYVVPDAPLICDHAGSLGLVVERGARSHTYVNDVGLPSHVPGAHDSCEPILGVPVICGRAVLIGAG